MASGTTTAERPKKHSAFMQVVFRKSGETSDLAGKALLGLSGVGQVLKAPTGVSSHSSGLILGLLSGGALLVLGIYLQAKAEETAS